MGRGVCIRLLGLGCLWAVCARGATLESLEAIVSQARSLDDFLSKPALMTAYRKALQTYYGETRFQCESYDRILAQLGELSRKVPGFADAVWAPREPRAFTYYQTNEGGEASRVRLVSPPRRLHGLWNNPGRRGCVTGDCGKSEIAAPERWAVALAESELYLVERDDRFAGGGILVMPLERDGRRYRLVTATGSAPVQARALFSTERAQRARRTSLWDLFLEGKRTEPGELVVVDPDPEDARALRLARLFPGDGENAVAGYLDEFRPGDPMAHQVASVAPRRCFARKGPAGLDLFAGFSGTGSGSAGMTLNYSDPMALKDLLATVKYPEEPGILATVPDADKPLLGKALARTMTGNGDDALREKAALALKILDGLSPREVPGRVTRRPASPGTGPAGGGDEYYAAFEQGLNDPNPAVRGLSAAALANRGVRTPEVNRALSDAIRGGDGDTGGSGHRSAPRGLTPGQIADLAARAGVFGKGGGLGTGDLGSLLDRAARETDPNVRQRLFDDFSKGYMQSQDPEALRRRMAELCQRDPALCHQLADQMRENQDECENTREFDRRRREIERREEESAALVPGWGAVFARGGAP